MAMTGCISLGPPQQNNKYYARLEGEKQNKKKNTIFFISVDYTY